MVSKKDTDPEKADTFDTVAPGVPRARARRGDAVLPSPASPPFRQQLLLLAGLALAGLCIAVLVITRAVEREREQMLAAIHGRADSLVWALEGSARFLDPGPHGNGMLARLAEEVARQPGVAWIAITDGAGRILADSNPELAGSVLYTPEELRRLAAKELQEYGRNEKDIKSLELYIKPEENAVYYVVNETETGAVALYE